MLYTLYDCLTLYYHVLSTAIWFVLVRHFPSHQKPFRHRHLQLKLLWSYSDFRGNYLFVDGSEILVRNHLLSMKPLKKGCEPWTVSHLPKKYHFCSRNVVESDDVKNSPPKWWEKWWLVCWKKKVEKKIHFQVWRNFHLFLQLPSLKLSARVFRPLKNRLWDKGSLTYSAKGPWNTCSNFTFPTNVIPKSLKVSHWLSKLILLPIFRGQW